MNISDGTLEEVTSGVWVAATTERESTMSVILGSEGKMAIDTTAYDRFALEVRRAINSHNDGPWRCVLATHSHFDHIGGNRVFDAPVVASRSTREEMTQYTDDWLESSLRSWVEQGSLDAKLLDEPKIVMPHITFDDALELDLGNLHLEVMVVGGHTQGSSVVFCPQTKVLFAGDLVFNGRAAVTTGGDVPQWIRSLERLQELEPEIVIAGHGRPGGPELLGSQLEELNALLE